MKKTFQSLSALALTFVMLLALAVPAFAAGTYEITINSSTAGHTYDAYQIFKGDISGSEAAGFVLSNIIWGDNIGSAGKSALANKLGLASDASAAVVANALAAGIDSDTVREIANLVGQNLTGTAITSDAGTGSGSNVTYTINGLEAGYYLVKDRDIAGLDAYTSFILEVIGDATATPKSAIPTVTKKVKENVKYTDNNGYNDVADYSIGDSVPFQLTGTLPSNYDDYTSYKYIFHDTLSGGLTYDSDSITVLVDEIDKTTSFEIAPSGNTLTVSINNLKGLIGVTITPGSKITVEYTATLNAGAVIGRPDPIDNTGNTNEVYLEYSNNPNPGGESNTGETPTDKVIVFTYELDVTKVDGASEGTKLPGAEFKLYKKVGVTNVYAVVGTNGTLTGWTDDAAAATTLISAADTGIFKVIGLDDGVYTLTEIKAPIGYNKLDADVEVVVTASTANGQSWDGVAANALTALAVTAGSVPGTGTPSTGIAAITIANNKGATLPSTGGVGTTIFYAVGGVLMLGAVVLLITKKRIGGK